MGSRYLTDLADVLRDAGLVVIEVDGWGTRSRSSGGFDGTRPWCVVWHHTASSTSPENDVSYICYGCPDAPVANLYLDRDGMVWVCAAGATNTNGKGRSMAFSNGVIPADQMNTHALGIECANDGVGEPYPRAQIDAYFKMTNALTAAYGLAVVDVTTHNEYVGDGRKIDPARAEAVVGPWRPAGINTSDTWSADDIRDELWLRSAQPPPPNPTPPPQEDDMPITFIAAAPNNATVLVAIDGAGLSILAFASETDQTAIGNAAGNPPVIHITEAQMLEITSRAKAGDTS